MSNQTPCMNCGAAQANEDLCSPCSDKMENVHFDRAALQPFCDWCSKEIWADEAMVLLGENVFHAACEREFGIFADGGAEAYRMEFFIAVRG